MVILESEAKAMICPMSIGKADHSGTPCHGAKCMAWRRSACDTGFCGMAGPPGHQDITDLLNLYELEREHFSIQQEIRNHE